MADPSSTSRDHLLARPRPRGQRRRWVLAPIAVGVFALGVPADAAAEEPPAALTWEALPDVARGAFDAGPGRAFDARAAGRDAARDAVAGPLESLDLGSRWEHTLSGPAGFEIGLDAVVTWRLGGLTDARRGAWRAEAEALTAERDLARFRFTAEAARRFAAWWARDALAVHVAEHLREQGHFLAPLRAAADQQLLSKLVVADLEVELARLDVEVTTLRADARVAARALVGLLGAGLAPSGAGLADVERLPPLAEDPWGPVRARLAAHPALRAFDGAERAARARAEAADAEGAARLSLGAGLRQEGADTPWAGVIVGVSIPLADPAADHAETARAEAVAQAAERAWHLRELEVDLAVESERYAASVERLRTVQTSLVEPMADRVLLVERALLVGRAPLEQLIRARRDLLEAHRALVEAAADVLDHHLRAAALATLLSSSPGSTR